MFSLYLLDVILKFGGMMYRFKLNCFPWDSTGLWNLSWQLSARSEQFMLISRDDSTAMNLLLYTWWVYFHDDVINGNIFFTGPWWGESTGRQWIPLTKASDAELWCFIWCTPEQTIEHTVETPVIWDAIARPCNVFSLFRLHQRFSALRWPHIIITMMMINMTKVLIGSNVIHSKNKVVKWTTLGL